MARLRYNNLSGTLGALLNASQTNVTFAAPLTLSTGVNVPTLTGSDYIVLVHEPGTANTEIDYLIAYTAGATTGTVTRGAEDATNWPAVAHANGAAFGCEITVADFPAVPTTQIKSANYTAANGDVVLVTTGAGVITITLPTATANNQVTVKKVDAGAGTVTVSGAGTIDGAASQSIAIRYQSFTMIADGTQWNLT